MSPRDLHARLVALASEPHLADLMALLNPAGEETRIVGGAIRNTILGEKTNDIDLSTTLLPDAVLRLAQAAGWHGVPTGIEHGTVTLIRDIHAFEVTTLREDIETDGRHAKVRFGRDFRADAARRDFTINALSLDRDHKLHDYFEGVHDLRLHKVRFIGRADQRLREDYLRGLRFLRFSAEYGRGRLDSLGLAAVLNHRGGFVELSRERIRAEMMKLVDARHAAEVIKKAEEFGLITQLLGVPADPAAFAARIALEGRFGEMRVPRLARFAALGVHDDRNIAYLRESMRLTNAEERWLHRIIDVQYRFRRDGLASLLLLGPEEAEIGVEALRREASARGSVSLLLDIDRVANPPVFHLSGKDALALGVVAGPAVGQALEATRTTWAREGFPPGHADQHAILAGVIRRMRER